MGTLVVLDIPAAPVPQPDIPVAWALLDQLVLDELGLAVELGYLSATDVIAALEQRPPHLDVILTGPCMPAALLAMADQVTQLRRGF